MILKNKDDPYIELVSYKDVYDVKELRIIYLRWLNDMDITRLIASEALYNNDKTESFIEDSFNRFMSSNCRAFFIKDLLKDKYIGTIKLDQISFTSKIAWDGIMIGDKSYHGKKISIRAYQVLLQFAFLELNLYKVMGGCNINNIAMIKTFQKIGYKQEGHYRNVDLIDDNYSDHLYFGIFKNEFNKNNNINLEIKS